jgi:exosortase family protein XrtF
MNQRSRSIVDEFKPTIYFLVRFIALYVTCSLLYGVYITSYEPNVDPLTNLITNQSSFVLNVFGWETTSMDYPDKPTTYIAWRGQGIVSVYEGCNGLNVIIVFLSFIMAFGPLNRKLLIYIPISLTVIYVANVARIVLLFFVVIYLQSYSYFAHKYFFTASIYLVVLLLWFWWIRLNRPARS